MRRPANALRTSLLALLALFAAGLALLAPSATAASFSTSSYASRLLSLVNAARADHGLPALRLASGTTTVAANWTAHMAGSQLLAHNPDLRHQIETHGSPAWGTYGENVGQGYAADPGSLFRAYMNSPEHRANILTGAYRYVGVAVSFTGKTAWNTFDFVDTYGTPTASKAPATKTVTHHHTTAAKTQAQPAPRPAPSAKPATAPAPRPVAKKDAHLTDHRHAATHRQQRVHVQGEHHRAARPEPIRELAVAAPTAVTPLAPLPTGRSSRAALVAVAVLALVAAARRWTLTVAQV
jgi:uncharacterized protein YkwD